MNNFKQNALSIPLALMEVNNAVKIELIRKYQRVEGNYDCCASVYVRVCKQFECLWRDECQTMLQG
jgi:hypothetical protein